MLLPLRLLTATAALAGLFMTGTAFCAPAGQTQKPAKGKSLGRYAVLSQYNVVTGNHLVLIGPDGYRDTYLKSGVVTVCAAPDFKVYTFNPNTRVYFAQPANVYQGYLHRSVSIATGRTVQGKRVVRVGEAALLKQKTIKYVSPPGYAASIVAAFKAGKTKGGEPAEIYYQTSLDLCPNKTINKVACQLSGCDDPGGYPLEVKYKMADGDMRSFLATTKIEFKTVSSDEFVMPAGFIAQNNLAGVFATRQTQAVDEYLFAPPKHDFDK